MDCPYCGKASSVTETRDAPDGVRRRRVCSDCKRRFTTYEKVGSPGLRVEKRGGREAEPFDAGKLKRALVRITRHRKITDDLERIARDIEASLVDGGQRAVQWSEIVAHVLRRLETIDKRSADRMRENYLDDAGELRLDDSAAAEPDQLELPIGGRS